MFHLNLGSSENVQFCVNGCIEELEGQAATNNAVHSRPFIIGPNMDLSLPHEVLFEISAIWDSAWTTQWFFFCLTILRIYNRLKQPVAFQMLRTAICHPAAVHHTWEFNKRWPLTVREDTWSLPYWDAPACIGPCRRSSTLFCLCCTQSLCIRVYHCSFGQPHHVFPCRALVCLAENQTGLRFPRKNRIPSFCFVYRP